MRRLALIILLLVYPLQVALAVADKCCVTTPAGVTHHGAETGLGAASAEPVFLVDDDRSVLTDPHCSACTFGTVLTFPRISLSCPRSATRRSALLLSPHD
jgi:hypothetical protein